MSARKWQRECMRYVQAAGVEDARLTPGSKHLHLTGTVNGLPFRTTVPQSFNRGWRGRVNFRSSIIRAVKALQERTRHDT